MSVSEPSRSYSSFMFEGKERLRADGINEYDQGGRRYAAAFPFFTTPDRKASSTPWLSPYSFCAANPINAVDPSGNLTIFINGFHCGDGGKSQYWEGVDKMVMKATNDPKALYIDGSIGGIFNLALVAVLTKDISAILSLSNVNPNRRKAAGYGLGVKKAVANQLKTDNGEKIRIITHSMGAAAAKGFIQGAKSVLGNSFTKNIEYEIDLAPYQPNRQSAVPGIKTYTIQHRDDKVARQSLMKGAEPLYQGEEEINGLGGHGIKSFELELENQLINLNNN